MTADLEQQILSALRTIEWGGRDIVSAGMVSGLSITKDKDVFFALEVDPSEGPKLEPLRQKAEQAARDVPGVRSASAVLTAENTKATQGTAAPSRTAGDPEAPDPHGMNKNPPLDLPVRCIIAVGSGKGGVGKSTVAYNIAAALGRAGYSTGLLDADIYGPSVPRLTGLAGRKPETDAGGKIIPLQAHGMKVMSIGFLVDEDKPMIWRGPMVQTAFYQMLRDVAWRNGQNDLDFLIIDMPPGTGDVQLTLAQKVPASGAVIVSTPQDLSLIDARKAVAMFEKTNVKILGLIENMSYYCCPSCGALDEVFGHGGARAEALKHGVPFLGEVPLNGQIRRDSDLGQPTATELYDDIVHRLIEALPHFDTQTSKAARGG